MFDLQVPQPPALLPATAQDMLAGFSLVASGCGAGGGGDRQYVRPTLTEVGSGRALLLLPKCIAAEALCSSGGEPDHQCIRFDALLPPYAVPPFPPRRAPSRWWRPGTQCWSAWTPSHTNPTQPTSRSTPPSTSSPVGGWVELRMVVY